MFSECGIIVDSNGRRISLDPKSRNNCEFTFVSHAHTDHLYKKTVKDNSNGLTLMSKVTSLIAKARGYKMTNAVEESEGFQLIDNGHILGYKGLLKKNAFYYTGEISTRERAFMK